MRSAMNGKRTVQIPLGWANERVSERGSSLFKMENVINKSHFNFPAKKYQKWNTLSQAAYPRSPPASLLLLCLSLSLFLWHFARFACDFCFQAKFICEFRVKWKRKKKQNQKKREAKKKHNEQVKNCKNQTKGWVRRWGRGVGQEQAEVEDDEAKPTNAVRQQKVIEFALKILRPTTSVVHRLLIRRCLQPDSLSPPFTLLRQPRSQRTVSSPSLFRFLSHWLFVI